MAWIVKKFKDFTAKDTQGRVDTFDGLARIMSRGWGWSVGAYQGVGRKHGGTMAEGYGRRLDRLFSKHECNSINSEMEAAKRAERGTKDESGER